MKSRFKVGISEENLLVRIQNDFTYAREEKESTISFMDARKEITRRNLVSQNIMKAMELWYKGDHWSVDKDNKAIKKSDHIVTPTVNYIQTIVDQRVDMFKRRRMTMDARPVGVEDLNLSIAAQYILKYFWRSRSVSSKLAQAYHDALVYSTGFAKVSWNPMIEDLDVIPISPLDIYPDPYGLEIDQLRYIHIVYNKPREYVEKKYETKLKKNEDGKENPNDSIFVYESWYSPFVFGKAMCIIWTDEKILDIKNVSEITGSDRFPIFSFKTRRQSNSFWGKSLVYNIADIQMLHNKSLGFILDSMILANNGRIVTSDPNIKISNDPREIITVSDANDLITTLNLATVDPRWFSVVSFSGYPLGQQLSGTYAINMGGQPNTQTATGIVALQNAGNTGVESDIFELTQTINEMGKVLMAMIKKTYGKDKIKKILGESKLFANKVDDMIDNFMKLDFDVFFDLSDPLPDDKLSRNNLFAGLLMQNKIDIGVYAKLTGNTELLAILQEQQAQQPQAMSQQLQQMIGGGQEPTQEEQNKGGEEVKNPSEEEKMKEKTSKMIENVAARAAKGVGI